MFLHQYRAMEGGTARELTEDTAGKRNLYDEMKYGWATKISEGSVLGGVKIAKCMQPFLRGTHHGIRDKQAGHSTHIMPVD